LEVKRLRRHLEREPKAVSAVLPILLRAIEAHLRQRIPGATVFGGSVLLIPAVGRLDFLSFFPSRADAFQNAP